MTTSLSRKIEMRDRRDRHKRLATKDHTAMSIEREAGRVVTTEKAEIIGKRDTVGDTREETMKEATAITVGRENTVETTNKATPTIHMYRSIVKKC
jgi:hypothetical protein